MITETRSGKVEGIERDGICIFKGIPYAAPPVGDRRWLAPAREEAWDGVRDASEFSAVCAQAELALGGIIGGTNEKSEDSLYLNVFTPGCDDARRPVMVWIHGGAFMMGSGDSPWYDGTKFAEHGDVVVVTLNYRLGAFGYLHLADLFGPEFEGSGNCGVLDQVAALEWVRDSIAGFGGNPDDITIFGESAGAGSVGTLLGLPRAKGLFKKAILESGGASWCATREGATEVAKRITEKLGVAPGDVAALRAKTMQELIDACADVGAVGVGTLPFQPVCDGTVLPDRPLAAIEAGNADGVHVMLGSNRHEMTLFNIVDPALATIDDAGMAEKLAAWTDAPVPIVAAYRAALPDAPGSELWTDLASDALFRVPMIWLAETQAERGSAVWMYLFTWETPVFGGLLKSTHAAEIPFVFDVLAGSEIFTGTGEERQGIADVMHAAWIAFARTGDPNCQGLPEWPRYDPARRATMRFDVAAEVLEDPMGDYRAAWGDFRR